MRLLGLLCTHRQDPSIDRRPSEMVGHGPSQTHLTTLVFFCVRASSPFHSEPFSLVSNKIAFPKQHKGQAKPTKLTPAYIPVRKGNVTKEDAAQAKELREQALATIKTSWALFWTAVLGYSLFSCFDQMTSLHKGEKYMYIVYGVGVCVALAALNHDGISSWWGRVQAPPPPKRSAPAAPLSPSLEGDTNPSLASKMEEEKGGGGGKAAKPRKAKSPNIKKRERWEAKQKAAASGAKGAEGEPGLGGDKVAGRSSIKGAAGKTSEYPGAGEDDDDEEEVWEEPPEDEEGFKLKAQSVVDDQEERQGAASEDEGVWEKVGEKKEVVREDTPPFPPSEPPILGDSSEPPILGEPYPPTESPSLAPSEEDESPLPPQPPPIKLCPCCKGDVLHPPPESTYIPPNRLMFHPVLGIVRQHVIDEWRSVYSVADME